LFVSLLPDNGIVFWLLTAAVFGDWRLVTGCSFRLSIFLFPLGIFIYFYSMKFLDVFSLALRTVRANKLRTGITVAIIAFGIMALVGIITAIEAMNNSLRESFSTMGANAFSLRYKERRIRIGGGGPGNNEVKKTDKRTARKEKKSNTGKIITFEQARQFKENYDYPAKVSIGLNGARSQVVSYENKKTNPTVTINGGDDNYLMLNGYEIAYGRNFNKLDVESGRSLLRSHRHIEGHRAARGPFGYDQVIIAVRILELDHE